MAHAVRNTIKMDKYNTNSARDSYTLWSPNNLLSYVFSTP